jgi:putative phosphoesterase
MLLGVLSDTHVPSRARCVPVSVLRAFEKVDLILHAGDLTTDKVLDELMAVAPVVAVQGNMCDSSVTWQLPEARLVTAGDFTIGLTHGHRGKGQTTADRARLRFAADDVDCVVFGHSHQPLNREVHGVLLFNPGSTTDKRTARARTYGILRVGEGIEGEIREVGE